MGGEMSELKPSEVLAACVHDVKHLLGNLRALQRQGTPPPPPPGEAARALLEAINCLYLEVDASIADDIMEKARQAIDESRGQEWVSVEDRLPEEGEQVIVWNDYLRAPMDGHLDGNVWVSVISRSRHQWNRVTHWRPSLPEPA